MTHITKEGLLQAVKELGTGPALYEPGVMDWILARAAELSAQESKPVATDIRLFDSQWVNIVNHDHCWLGWSMEKAIHKAVELAEKYMRENIEKGWPKARAQSVSAQDASPKDVEPKAEQCPSCMGHGYDLGWSCPYCNGTGFVLASQAMCDTTRGLYNKFNVMRADGSSEPGGKHDGCEYFVLDLTHDKFAKDAIRAYATACREKYPLLARDLMIKATP